MNNKLAIGILLILLFLLPFFYSPDFNGSLDIFLVTPFKKDFLTHIMLITFFILHYKVFLKLLKQKKIIHYLLTIMISYMVIVIVPTLVFNEPNQFYRTQIEQGFSVSLFKEPQRFFRVLPGFLLVWIFGVYLYQNEEKNRLEKEQYFLKLNKIKTQLQPHFLFNVLNNIYGLSLDNSESVSEAILKLSNIMRYVVQESEKERVKLKDEISYMKDYIALFLLRTDDSLDFSFREEGDYQNHTIVPMILFNYIENAFKYGFSSEEKSKISIAITLHHSELQLKVFNLKIKTITPKTTLIGNTITEELLHRFYDEKYRLAIEENDTFYQVDLKLDLA